MLVASRNYALIVISAVVLFLAYPGINLAPLAWIGLAPLLIATANIAPKHGAFLFFVCGTLFHLLLLQWLLANVYWAGGWAIIGYILLSLLLGSYWGVCGGVWCLVRTRMPIAGGALGFAILWAAMEKIAEVLFTGFGWSALAYSQGPNLPLLQWTAIGSVPLVGFILALVNAHVALIYIDQKGRIGRIAAAVAVAALAEFIGVSMMKQPTYPDDPIKVGMFQSSFPLEMKWDEAYQYEMVAIAAEATAELDRTEDLDLAVWPEALVTGDIEAEPIRSLLENLTADHNLHLLTGAARRAGGDFYNSLYSIDETGAFLGHYDKIRLAPFGEYVPLSSLLPFVESMVPVIGAVSAGNELQTFETGGRVAGPLICFEMLFPHAAGNLRAAGADYLVVVTNLSWFGPSSAIPQELDIARIRAIENRLPLVHSANTGISGVIGPWGRFAGLEYIVVGGRLYHPRTSLEPEQTIRLRMAGSAPLPEAGAPTSPIAPATVAWTFVGLALFMLAAAILFGKGTQPIEAVEE